MIKYYCDKCSKPVVKVIRCTLTVRDPQRRYKTSQRTMIQNQKLEVCKKCMLGLRKVMEVG